MERVETIGGRGRQRGEGGRDELGEAKGLTDARGGGKERRKRRKQARGQANR